MIIGKFSESLKLLTKENMFVLWKKTMCAAERAEVP